MKFKKFAAVLLSALITAAPFVSDTVLAEEEDGAPEVVGSLERYMSIIEEEGWGDSLYLTGFDTAMGMTKPASSGANSIAAESARSDYSGTNLQVEGVDEADLIKTDGRYIYYVQDDILRVVEADSDGYITSVFSREFSGFFPDSLFLDDEHLVVIGHRAVPVRTRYAQGSYWYYSTREYATAIVFGIADKSNITELREISLEGRVLSSRKIKDTLYLVSSMTLSDYTKPPVYRDSVVSAENRTVPFDSMYLMPIRDTRQITFIATVDLSEPEKSADVQSFIGAAGEMYMSETSLYLSARKYSPKTTTVIYKFALGKDSVEYQTLGRVDGWLINQFAMDEHNGNLRVATTNDSSNSLFVLDGDLKKMGDIKDIAPGERIYSVRFLGERGFVVTFKQTDPLFAFDLSDPNDPKLLGALKIPGYSTYLHPYDENHLIGFGQDTETTSSGGVIATGLKMSMFDITDMTDPKELFVEYLGEQGSTSPLLQNHKAILQSTEKDIFAFPAYEYTNDISKSGRYNPVLNRQGAFIYSIDMDDGFILRGVITHKTEEEILKAGYYGSYSKTDVERVIYIGGAFYTISADRIQSNRIDTLEYIDSNNH